MAGGRPVCAAFSVVFAALLMAGCGSDDDAGPTTGAPLPTEPSGSSTSSPAPTAADVRCPYEGFSTVFVPRDWTAASIEVCHDDTQRNVLVVNVSSTFISVAPGASATLNEWSQSNDPSFQNMVYGEVVRNSSSTTDWLIPPGGWVTIKGTPASAIVGLPPVALATAYASDKVIGYVESRLASPSRAAAQRVANCVSELGVTIANTQDPSVGLDYLLADSMLGAGVQCRSLLRELTDDAPPSSALKGEFARIRSSVRASAVDDLVRAARNFIQVLR